MQCRACQLQAPHGGGMCVFCLKRADRLSFSGCVVDFTGRGGASGRASGGADPQMAHHHVDEMERGSDRADQVTQEQSPSSSRAQAVRALAMRLQQSDYHSALLADELLRTQAAAAAAAQTYGACGSTTALSPVSFASPPSTTAAAAAAAATAAGVAAAMHSRISIETTGSAPATFSSAAPGSCSSSSSTSIRERLERLLHQRAEGDSSLVHSEQHLAEEAGDVDPFIGSSRSPQQQQQLLNGHATATKAASCTVRLQQRSVAMFMSLALRCLVKARLSNSWHRWRQVSSLSVPQC
jgi:hypothetical protein